MTFLLVGPRGQAVVLMNDVGGGSSEAVTGVDLRFDDEAPYGVPEFDALESKSYQPTNAENPPAEYPPPAPGCHSSPGHRRRWASSTAPTPTGPGGSSASTTPEGRCPPWTAGRCTSVGPMRRVREEPSPWTTAQPGPGPGP